MAATFWRSRRPELAARRAQGVTALHVPILFNNMRCKQCVALRCVNALSADVLRTLPSDRLKCTDGRQAIY